MNLLFYQTFQSRRIEKMDHFFGCLATLMSRHLRLAVGLSLDDLVTFFEQYSDGSSYEGGAETPVSTLGQPIIIRLVSSSISFHILLAGTFELRHHWSNG